MRKNALLWGIIVLLINFNSEGEKNKLASYQDKNYNFQFTYPKNWILKTDEAKNGYLALYSPEALAARKKYKTNNLLCGIKIEFWTLTKNESNTQLLEGTTACFFLEKNNKKITQYCKKKKKNNNRLTETPYLLYVLCLIKDKKYKTLIIAYIPEKKKRGYYRQNYNQILLSFKFKSSS
jgi:hypothetical protein